MEFDDITGLRKPNKAVSIVSATSLVVGCACAVLSGMVITGGQAFHEHVLAPSGLLVTVPCALAFIALYLFLSRPAKISDIKKRKSAIQKERQRFIVEIESVSPFVDSALNWRETAFSNVWHEVTYPSHQSIERLIWKYQVLSMGRSDVTYEELCPDDSKFDFRAGRKDYKDTVAMREREMRDISKIWSSKYVLNGLCLYNPPFSLDDEEAADRIIEFGKILGVDSMLESYYNGVPLEHIIAE